MYKPSHYVNDSPGFIFRHIKANPFATLVLQGEELFATHTPVLPEGKAGDFILRGHVANHNPIAGRIEDGQKALLIFMGPNAYVSSSWYEEPDISTWNYSAVHVHGSLQRQNEEDLISSLRQLVRHFESEQPHPLYYKDIPGDLIGSHLPLITGFNLIPEKINGVEKWSQTRSREDRRRIYRKLKNKQWMSKKNLKTKLKIKD